MISLQVKLVHYGITMDRSTTETS